MWVTSILVLVAVLSEHVVGVAFACLDYSLLQALSAIDGGSTSGELLRGNI